MIKHSANFIKKMKTNLITLAAAFGCAAALSSCDRQDNVSTSAIEQDTETVTLSVSVGNPSTKSTATWADEAISKLGVYIFDADGSYAASGYDDTGESTVDIECQTGSGKTIFALVNYTPDVKDTSSLTISDMMALTSDLSENSTSAFVMSGMEEDVEITTSSAITIDVYRVAAKVSIDKIVNAIADETYIDSTFTLKGIYLINAPVDGYPLCDLEVTSYTPSTWMNKGGYVSSSTYDTYLYDSVGEVIKSDGIYDTTHEFYCYPNFTENDSQDEEWCARKTRLVVEVDLGSDTYYYPISLDEVIRNKHYHFTSLTITLRGSTDPDYPIETENFSYSVKIEDWDDVEMGGLTI